MTWYIRRPYQGEGLGPYGIDDWITRDDPERYADREPEDPEPEPPCCCCGEPGCDCDLGYLSGTGDEPDIWRCRTHDRDGEVPA